MTCNKPFYRIIVLICMVLFLNCKDKPTQAGLSGVSVTATENSVVVFNMSRSTIYSTAFEQEIVNVVDWVPLCGTPIGTYSFREIKYQDNFGYSEGCKVVVYWWTCVAGKPDSLYNSVIQTK